MLIGIDAMGGDKAPEAVVRGAVDAHKELNQNDTVVLIGNADEIRPLLEKYDSPEHAVKIEHAPAMIHMDDQPTRAYSTKKDSSINRGFTLLKEGKIDSFASAGNTGAMLVGAFYEIGVIQGLIRPTTIAQIPKEKGVNNVLLDVGTNPDVKPDVLNQFALLGSLYAEHVLKIKKPRVGLLNIGNEDKKGNILTQSAFPILKDNHEINFIGNVESRDVFGDIADVIVTDGFTGNIVLKQIESFHQIMTKRNCHDEFLERLDFQNFGGTPVAGINKSVLIGHGISEARAFKNMIINSRNFSEVNLPEIIRQKLTRNVVM